MHFRKANLLRTVLIVITLLVGLSLPARMASAIDRFTIQFDGASTGTGNDARPLTVVFELTGFATPQGVLTIYIGQLALVDAPSDVTEFFGPLSQYALDESMSPGTLDVSGATGQPSHLLFTMGRKSETYATRWDLRMVGEKATLVGTAGKRTFTFVGRVKGYEPTGDVSEELPLSTVLVASGIGLVALIGLGWFWDTQAKKAAVEKLRRRVVKGYAVERQVSGRDASGRPIYLATDPQMICLSRRNKMFSITFRVIFLASILLLLRVDAPWMRNEIREAFLRPMSLTMDVSISFWLTSAVVTPWQLIASAALMTALMQGSLRSPSIDQKTIISSLAGVLTGATILFLGLMGHASTIGILGLSIIIAGLLIPILGLQSRVVWLLVGACIVLSIPLPESILAAIQGRIGIPTPGGIGYVAIAIDLAIGSALALWLGKHHRKREANAGEPKVDNSGFPFDYAALFAALLSIGVLTSGSLQHRQVQAQSTWMPIAPLQIGQYKTRLVDVDAEFLALVGKPKAKLYDYKSAGKANIVMTVVNGAHLDAYHDPTICMAQGDFVYKGQLSTPPGLSVRRLEFASQSRPSQRLILDYWEQDKDGGIETAAKMGRLKHLPNRILKGLRQLAGTPPVVIIRAQVECDGRKACAKAENALSNISRNVQLGIR